MNFFSKDYLERLLALANKELSENYTLEDIIFTEKSKERVNRAGIADVYDLYMRDNMQLAFTVYVKLEFNHELTRKLTDEQFKRDKYRVDLANYKWRECEK